MNQEKPIGFFSSAPKRAELQITLPSGRQVTILETTGQQEAIFRAITKDKPAAVVSRFLAQVTQDLDGQEGVPPENKFDEMLQWDRSTILLQVRTLSHGPIVNYKINCTKCHKKSEHEVDLQPILDSIKPYPNGDQRTFKIELDGGVLCFELPTGDTEKKLSDMPDADINKRLYALRMWEETPKGNLPVSVDNLRSKHIAALRKKLKELEAEIDAVATLVCQGCGATYSVGIVENPDFLFPNLT